MRRACHELWRCCNRHAAAAAAAKSLQSCTTLCDPIDSGPPGSPVPGILQARTLEWVAISFSNAWKWKVKVKSLSHVRLFATPWTAAYQAPPPMIFCHAFLQGIFPDPGKEPRSLMSPSLAGGFFTTSATWEATPHIPHHINYQAQPTLPLKYLLSPSSSLHPHKHFLGLTLSATP